MLTTLLTLGSLQLLVMLVLLVRTKGLAVLLGPELFGVMGAVDRLVAVFAQTASLSLPLAALRFLPSRWREGPAAYAALFRSMRAVLLPAVLLATGAGVAVAAFAPAWLGGELAAHRLVVGVAFLTAPATVLVPFLQQAIAARFQHQRSMLFALGHAVVLAVTALAGAAWSGLAGLYVLYAVAGVALSLGPLLSLGRVPPGTDDEGARGASGLARDVWRYSLVLLGLSFATPFAALYVYQSVLGGLGAEAAGWMQAAMGIAIAARSLLGAAHRTVLWPALNEGGTPEQRMRAAHAFQRALCLLVGLTVPPLLLVPDLAVRLLYAETFVPAGRYVALFVLVEVVTLLAGAHQALVLALDHLAFQVAQSTVAQLAVLAGAMVLVPRAGIAGAALATLAAPLVSYAATALFLRRRHGLRTPPALYTLALVVLLGLTVTGWVGLTSEGITKLFAGALAMTGTAVFLRPTDLAAWRQRSPSAQPPPSTPA